MDDIPEFVIGEVASAQPRRSGSTGGNPSPDEVRGQMQSAVNNISPWEFTVQVLMRNPQVFQSQPEQYTHGLAVRVFPNGRVISAPYGTSEGGMTIWAETDVNAAGQKVLRFPFAIPGM